MTGANFSDIGRLFTKYLDASPTVVPAPDPLPIGWGRIRKISNWHTGYELNGRQLKGGDTIELHPGGTEGFIGVVKCELREHRGLGGMDESWSWDVLHLDSWIFDIKIEDGHLARFLEESQ